MRYVILLSLVLLFSAMQSAAAASATSPAYTDPVTGMAFVAIPGGTFTMGGTTERFEQPAHEVTIKPFLFGKQEVTFDQFAVFCKATGRKLPSDNGWGRGKRPVINVSWDDAVAFTTWLSQKTGKKFRLPSESEWEYAARAGAPGRFPWGDELGKNRANCQECGSKWDGKMTAPVGSFVANGYGLHDMIGNVYEWCLDNRHENYVGAPIDGSPRLTGGDGPQRVKRGGSFRQEAHEMTIVRRCWQDSDNGYDEVGFRVVREQ